MEQSTRFVGMDVHKDTIVVAVTATGEVGRATAYGTFPNTAASLQTLVKRLRQAWPEVRLILRGDSGFCRHRVMNWCERHHVRYVLGLARNPVLQRHAAPWLTQVEAQHRGDGQAHRVFGEFTYAAATWSRQATERTCPSR